MISYVKDSHLLKTRNQENKKKRMKKLLIKKNKKI